ncbi:uncharacterized protein V1518DRAFT_416292 [Limtongia smithiae]|uniref:uncharacterized protein n=1 Tax=Limtongia smithiae TaxID=1125753 RepID=UPI0034CE8D6F
MDSSSFVSVPLRSSGGFSYIFLIELIVVAIVVVFVLFYFNRVVGTVLSLSVRWYVWHKYRVFMDIRSVQISVLGGRVFFKDIRYIGTNEAIFAVHGNVTWRYWLNRTRKSGVEAREVDTEKNSALPARFKLYVEGLEWFVYNRTPAYDAAFAMYESKIVNNRSGEKISEQVHTAAVSDSTYSSDAEHAKKRHKDEITGLSHERNGTHTSSSSSDPSKSVLLEMFPIDIKCGKGSMVVGNLSTPTIMIYHFGDGLGSIDAVKSRSPYDYYKMVYDFTFNRASMQIRANMDCHEMDGKTEQDDDGGEMNPNKRQPHSKWQSVQDYLSFLYNRHGYASRHVEEEETPKAWHGLSRYLDEDETHVHEVQNEDVDEYAKCISVLDANAVKFTFYYDVTGFVPPNPEPLDVNDGKKYLDIGNGGLPPEWGMNVVLSGATVQYGPWADRQRVILSDALFPAVREDSEPHQRLRPGDMRIATDLLVYVELDNSTIIRIPMRERSKDAEFKKSKQNDKTGATSIRPFGWIELKTSELSTMTYSSAIVAGPSSWPHKFTAELNGLQMRSSVNHDIWWSSKVLTICGDLSSPLKWNGQNEWVFDIDATNARTFLLREHVTLISDMMLDFAASPETPYELFVPHRYLINFSLSEFDLFLNVNDSNIISNPSDFDDNIFLAVSCPKFTANVDVPLLQIAPLTNEVKFLMGADSAKLVLWEPPWNTFASFLQSKDLGRITKLDIDGSFSYAVSKVTDPIDTITMDISTEDITLIFCGLLIRYFIKIRENYFGENVKFKTLDEFTKSTAATNKAQNGMDDLSVETTSSDSMDGSRDSNAPETSQGSTDKEQHSSTAEDYIVEAFTDVLISYQTEHGCLIFPRQIYSASSHLRLDFDMFDLDLRFTNYYMDLQTNISPINGLLLDYGDNGDIFAGRTKTDTAKPDLFIDGLTIYGHRMFGLPPTEPTYVCNWDFDLGIMFTEGGPTLYEGLCDVLSAFKYTFSDKENALIVMEPPLYDMTLLRVNLRSLKMLVHTENATFELLADQILLTLNDWATRTYNSRMNAQIPEISFLCRDRIAPDGNSTTPGRILAYFHTSLYMSNFDRKKYGEELSRLQQCHLRSHDASFGRIPFLLSGTPELERVMTSSVDESGGSKVQPIVLSVPPMPPTLKLVDSVMRLDDDSDSSSESMMSSGSVIHHDISNLPSERISDRRAYLQNYISTCQSAIAEQHGGYSSTFMPPYSCVTAFRDLESVKNGSESRFYDMDEGMVQGDPSSIDALDNSETAKDSYVVELRGGVEGVLTAAGLENIVDIIDALSRPSMKYMLDRLQISIIERLEANLTSVDKVLSARIIIPGLHIRYGEINNVLQGCTMSPPNIEMHDHIELEVKAVVFSVRIADKSEVVVPDQPVRRNPIIRKHSLCFNLYQMSLSLVHCDSNSPKGNSRPLKLQIERIEAWNRQSPMNIMSIKIRSIGLFAQSRDMVYIANYIFDIMKPLVPLSEKVADISARMDNRMKNLVYLIAVTSSAYEIAHDPAFLTRPAYVLRSSNMHIRANDSWKLMARLRHILRSLPEDIVDGINRDLAAENLVPPADAKQRVIKVLLDWRNWEMIDIKSSYVFAHVFDGDQKVIVPQSPMADVLLDVETINVSISHNSEHDDYLQLLFLTFNVSSKEVDTQQALPESMSVTSLTRRVQSNMLEMSGKSKRVKKIITVTAGCEEVQVTNNWSSILIYQDVASVFEKRRAAKPPASSTELAVVDTVTTNAGTIASTSDIECHAVVTLRSCKSRLYSKNFTLQTSGHSIEYSVVVNISQDAGLVPSSVLLRTTAFELDMLDPFTSESRIMTLGVMRSDVCVSVFNLPSPTNVQSFIRVNEVSFDVADDFIALSRIISNIVDDEVRQIIDILPTPEAKQAMGEVADADASTLNRHSPLDILGLSIDLRNYNIRLNMLPSLKFRMTGSAVQVLLTPVKNSTRSVAFEAGAQVYEFRQRKKARESMITETTLPKLTALVRVARDQAKQQQTVTMRVNMGTVNFDASSFPTLASVLSGDVTKAELHQAQKKWNGTMQFLKLFSANEKLTPQRDVPPLAQYQTIFNLSVFIRGIVLQAAAANSQIVMSIDNIKIKSNSPTHARESNDLYTSVALPKIEILVRSKRFKTGQMRVLDTDLMVSVRTAQNSADQSSAPKAIAISCQGCHLVLSPYSSTLMVEILSQFEEKLTNMEFSEELSLFKSMLTEGVPAQPAPEELSEAQMWNNLFSVLIGFQFKNGSLCWVSDVLDDNDANDRRGFYTEIRSESFRLTSKGRGLITMQIKQCELVAGDMITMTNSQRDLNMPRESSAVIPMIALNVSLNKDGATNALGVNMKSSGLKVAIIPTIVRTGQSIESSVTTTVQSVVGKIENYKRRVAAHAEKSASSSGQSSDTSSDATAIVPMATSTQPFFSAFDISSAFAGTTVELYGRTNNKYTEEPLATPGQPSLKQSALPKGPVGTLRVPGVWMRAKYTYVNHKQTLHSEIFVEASSNTIFPRVMPIIDEMAHYLKENMREPKQAEHPLEHAVAPTKMQVSPATKLPGNLDMNIGVMVGPQEFSLSCEPIAKVAAMATFSQLYVSVNTFHKPSIPRYFAVSVQLLNLRASLQHVFSRESSAWISVRDLTLVSIASEKITRQTGLSFAGKVEDVDLYLNLKESHDLLLFQDIWSPGLDMDAQHTTKSADEQAELLVQRYHRVTSTNAFPWKADIELLNMTGNIDLGQSLGKVTFFLDKFWLASRKTSDWEQNLTFGICHFSADSKGRLGGQFTVEDVRARSAIRWQETDENDVVGAPLIQLAAGIEKIHTKLYFDDRLFLIAIGSHIHLTMFNQRGSGQEADRLVCIADCNAVKLYLTVLAQSNILTILTTIKRMDQERALSYQAVLRDSERFNVHSPPPVAQELEPRRVESESKPVSLRTSLDVRIKMLVVNVFPTTLADTDVLKVEALNMSVKFGIDSMSGKVQSHLELMLGQFLVALSTMRRVHNDLSLVEVDEFAQSASEAKGGTIMRIPAVSVSMTTWQAVQHMTTVEFIFNSVFEGRVDVGWNIGAINFIREMWNSHVRSLQIHESSTAQDEVKTPFESHLLEMDEIEKKLKDVKLDKTFTYVPVQPPVIATPQLKDMGEATPPVEWLGLNRDRLPGLTHQAVITTLQTMSRKVESAYANVLGKA